MVQDDRGLSSRILTALVLIPVVLGAFYWPGPVVLALLGGIVVLLGSVEAARLTSASAALVGMALLWFIVGMVPGVEPAGVTRIPVPWIWLLIWIIASVSLVAKPPRLAWLSGGVWVGLPLGALCSLQGRLGGSAVLLAVASVWAADTFAYFAGRQFGKRLLAPSISPKKTWEGAVGGLIGAIVFGLTVCAAIHQSLLLGALAGVSAGTYGPAGDLLESYLKRASDVKDSGSILPGHGGVLDRIDGLLAAAIPNVLLIQYFWVGA